ncbi:single-stranded DNA-binding protein [Phenylobacterium kunshanense]|uniref:Single-stranded DNA-binding protein n=1 Tax=Phenylobacterium kunshanense TaxID=1445034 RepID=A0A328B6D0_9CAUL|nr:single-stranded DNA-binding protein [Phenylobacterium kunshanense]RAK61941.1 single-stranded DNA-binding protein [Phenylobacterium kunshanense]
MLNKTQLIGRLGADPEVRSLNDGAKVTNLRLATSETWKDRDTGERKERTDWHRVTVWGDGSAKYLSHATKGAMLFVEGRLTTRRWTDADGVERASTEIVVRSGSGQLKILGDRLSRRDADHSTTGSRHPSGSEAEQTRLDL